MIASKTVGKAVGLREEQRDFVRVVEEWRKVWSRDEVWHKKELLLMVSLDERPTSRDWVFVIVSSCVVGGVLGEAQQIRMRVFDVFKRANKFRLVARNVNLLVRGVAACSAGAAPVVEFADVPPCLDPSRRILCAFGLLMNNICEHAKEKCLDALTEAFVSNVSHVLRGVFAHLRKLTSERGERDVERVLLGEAGCRDVLQMLGKPPTLHSRSFLETIGDGRELRVCASSSGSGAKSSPAPVLRVATWNIAGGHRSSQAPARFGDMDQRSAVLHEIRRWHRSYVCDIIALQECEQEDAYAELQDSHGLLASAAAKDSRGFVHIYVRKGITAEVLDTAPGDPAVAVRVTLDTPLGKKENLAVAAVHLPTGDAVSGLRARILARVQSW